MNPAVKAMWLRDLRSGEFRQGKHKLRGTDDEYCCLGVLCERAVREGIIPPAELSVKTDLNGREAPSDRYCYGDGEDVSTGVLPGAVSEWAGLIQCNPETPVPDELREEWGPEGTVGLAGLNDDAQDRFPFTRIAELIETHL